MHRVERLIEDLCPEGVEYKSLKSICKISRGRVISKDYLREHSGDYPVYSSQTVNDGILGKIDTYAYDGKFLTWTTDGANAGSVFYRAGKFSVTNVCGLLSLTAIDVELKYLYYILSISTKKHVNQGMGNPKLMSNVMGLILIPVPPLAIQEEIVHILDKFTALEAELEAELEARKKQYEYYRDELFRFDDEVEWKTLGEVLCMKAGKHIKADQILSSANDTHQYKCYGGNGIRGFVETFNKQGNYAIIGRQGALCGNLKFASGAFYATEHAVVVEPREPQEIKFFYYLLDFMNLNQYASKSAQPGLSVKRIEKIPIPVPPLAEQERIVNILDRFDQLVNDISTGLPAEIAARRQQYEHYRNQLLTFKPLPHDHV